MRRPASWPRPRDLSATPMTGAGLSALHDVRRITHGRCPWSRDGRVSAGRTRPAAVHPVSRSRHSHPGHVVRASLRAPRTRVSQVGQAMRAGSVCTGNRVIATTACVGRGARTRRPGLPLAGTCHAVEEQARPVWSCRARLVTRSLHAASAWHPALRPRKPASVWSTRRCGGIGALVCVETAGPRHPGGPAHPGGRGPRRTGAGVIHGQGPSVVGPAAWHPARLAQAGASTAPACAFCRQPCCGRCASCASSTWVSDVSRSCAWSRARYR